MPRRVPKLTTDEEAEAFLDQDLSDLNFSQFKTVHFEFEKKAAQLNMRLPPAPLKAVKERAGAGHPLHALRPRGAGAGGAAGVRVLSSA
jgi:predicted DNA binding CopG/RHH family protein